jgi:type IV pilus assembly protein PilF
MPSPRLHPPTKRRCCPLGWAIAGWILGLAVGLLGCAGPASKTPTGDPEQMSRSEYDVARDLWLRQGRPREALGHALRSTELDDRNHEALHLVALIYLDFCQAGPDSCRLPEAEQYARRALSAREDFREARNTLGVILIHEKKYSDAILVLKPLTEDILYVTPENAWGNLGWAYLESGAFERAVDALRRSVAAQPNFCVGNYRLGLAHQKRGEHALAMAALDAALGTDQPRCKSMQEAYLARGRAALALGRGDSARSDLAHCVELSHSTQVGKECASILQKLK